MKRQKLIKSRWILALIIGLVLWLMFRFGSGTFSRIVDGIVNLIGKGYSKLAPNKAIPEKTIRVATMAVITAVVVVAVAVLFSPVVAIIAASVALIGFGLYVKDVYSEPELIQGA